MKGKKAQAINITTIIIIILALLVLIIVAAAFSGGFGQLWKQVGDILHISGATSLDVLTKSCESFCATQAKNAFCDKEYSITIAGQDEPSKVKCRDPPISATCGDLCKVEAQE